MSPSGETKEALQPPSETTAPIGSPVRSAKRFGSIFSPSFCSSGPSCGICCGIHIPSVAKSGVARRQSNKNSFFTYFLPSDARGIIGHGNLECRMRMQKIRKVF